VQSIHLLPSMQNTLRDYEQYCRDRLYLRPWTLHNRTTELTIFLDFLHSRKSRTLDQIQAADLSEFVSCRNHLQPETVARIASDVRSLLRFLTLRGILQKDLSAELPKIRVPRDATIPSVWDQELIVRLLGAVDRSSAKGKRDYAILLLACRLGLRAGDIRTLKLDHLRWAESTIEITQAKTDMPLRLIVAARFSARDSYYALTPVNVVKAKSSDLLGPQSQVRQTSCDGIVATAGDRPAIKDRKQAPHFRIGQDPGQRCEALSGRSRHSNSECFLTLAVKPQKTEVAAERRGKNFGTCRFEASSTFRQVLDHVLGCGPRHYRSPIT